MPESQRYFTHSFNSTRGYLSLPGLHILFLFFFPFPSPRSFPIWVLLHVCTLLQLCLGLNFGMSLSLQDDWRLGRSQGQLGTKKVSWCLEYINGHRTQGALM